MTAGVPDGTASGGAARDDASIPALLRGARGSYAHTIAAFLDEAGCGDLPQNGPFVLGGMATQHAAAVDMIRGLGVTRQAASQLIDTLVVRGYLSREVNPADRRRLNIELTERGRAAAEAIGAAIGRVDEELAAMITPAELAGLRAGLIALAQIRERTRRDDELGAEFDASGAGQGRTPRDTDYKMRELAHIDPDGNLLLFGSPLREDPAAASAAAGDGPAAQPGPGTAPDRRVFEFATALKQGNVDRLRALLAADPGLATSLINACTPLHLFADAPGHRPNPAGVVSALAEAGADLNAHATGTWHHETPLHWAASNDDIELIDALLDAGADIEHPGSSISGGPPAESALGYAQWRALRRLHERGAAMNLSRAAALGLMPLVTALATAIPPPDGEELAIAFWNACRAGQLEAARYLAGRGADINWRAPWSGQTPLDAARDKGERAVAAWLTESGATSR